MLNRDLGGCGFWCLVLGIFGVVYEGDSYAWNIVICEGLKREGVGGVYGNF